MSANHYNRYLLLSEHECMLLAEHIRQTELNTKGEIRVHIEMRCLGSAIYRAAEVFEKLGMHHTQEHTGILIYLSAEDHKIAIYADIGIYTKLTNKEWDNIRDEIVKYLRNKQIFEGIKHGIDRLGQVLALHFPQHGSPINELSNDITFGYDIED